MSKEPKMLTVIWGSPGVPCPMVRKVRVIDRKTGRDHTMIYDEPVDVPDVPYYRRRIRVGDLEIVKTDELKQKPKKRGIHAMAPAAPAERKDD